MTAPGNQHQKKKKTHKTSFPESSVNCLRCSKKFVSKMRHMPQIFITCHSLTLIYYMAKLRKHLRLRLRWELTSLLVPDLVYIGVLQVARFGQGQWLFLMFFGGILCTIHRRRDLSRTRIKYILNFQVVWQSQIPQIDIYGTNAIVPEQLTVV